MAAAHALAINSGNFMILFAVWKCLRTPPNRFFQTHRSFIVNYEHITDFDHTLVHLVNGQFDAYLTKRKYSAFKEAYLLYLESTR